MFRVAHELLLHMDRRSNVGVILAEALSERLYRKWCGKNLCKNNSAFSVWRS